MNPVGENAFTHTPRNRILKISSCIFALLAGIAVCASPSAHTLPVSELRNVVNLTASASIEIPQDLLTLTLSTTKEGTEPAVVQAQVRQAVEAALSEARKTSQPGAMDVRSGAISLQPRYTRDSKISGWIGSAELILEGSDFARIGATAGRVQAMTIANAYFGLSREARLKAEAEVQSAAIERFKSRAADIARSFGFTGFAIREVAVSGDEQGNYMPQPRAMAMKAGAMLSDSAPVPLESGKTNVAIRVNGSVQLK